jgi:hypothetical protein
MRGDYRLHLRPGANLKDPEVKSLEDDGGKADSLPTTATLPFRWDGLAPYHRLSISLDQGENEVHGLQLLGNQIDTIVLAINR